MRALLLLLFLSFTSAFALMPGGIPAPAQKDDGFSSTIPDVNKYTADTKARIKTTTDEIFGTELATPPVKVPYFDKITTTTCKSVSDLKCPPLNPAYAKNHTSIVNYINPASGSVSCSVFANGDLSARWKKEQAMAPVYTQVFTKKACVQTFALSNNIDTSEDATVLREQAQKREDEFKAIEQKYLDEFKTSGGEKYLDLADWLDALATVDAEKIDITQTLKSGTVTTKPGYTIIPNQDITQQFEEAIKSLMAKNHGKELSNTQVEDMIAKNAKIESQNAKVSNSQYVMYLDFFSKSNSIINQTLNVIMIVFLMFNVLVNWIFKNTTEKWSGVKNSENHFGRLIFGSVIFITLYVGTVERLQVKNVAEKLNSSQVQDFTQEIEIKSQKIQDIARALYAFTNDLSDKLTKIATSSYLKALGTTSGLADVLTIDTLLSQRISLQKQNEFLKQVDQECTATYDLSKLESSLKNYKNSVLKNSVPDNVKHTETTSHIETKRYGAYTYDGFDTDKGFNYAKNVGAHSFQGIGWNETVTTSKESEFSLMCINPYPSSENEARASLYTAKINPYSQDGYLKNTLVTNTMSLSGCNFNRKKILENYSAINLLNAKLQKTTNSTDYENKKERLKNVYAVVSRNFAELGYLSMALLPATSMLVDNQGDLGDRKSRDEKDEDITQYISRNAAYLALFSGNSIADAFNSLMGGSLLTKPFALGASLYTITQLIDMVPVLFLSLGGILAFLLNEIMKLFAYFAIIFLIIYAFSPKQEEKIFSGFAKLIIIAFKSPVLVFAMFISIFVFSLLTSFENILISTVYNNMGAINYIDPAQYSHTTVWYKNFGDWFKETIGNVSSFGSEKFAYFKNEISAGLIYGLSHALFVVLKVLAVYAIMFKYPGNFFDMLSVKSDDISASLHESIENAVEKETLKGI